MVVEFDGQPVGVIKGAEIDFSAHPGGEFEQLAGVSFPTSGEITFNVPRGTCEKLINNLETIMKSIEQEMFPWKLLAMMMQNLGKDEMQLTQADMEAIESRYAQDGAAVVLIEDKGDHFRLRLMSEKDARAAVEAGQAAKEVGFSNTDINVEGLEPHIHRGKGDSGPI